MNQSTQDHAFYPPLALHIDGCWEGAQGRETRSVTDPATELVIGQLPVATEADIDQAIAAAERAFPAWRSRTPQQRAEILNKAADLIRERRELIAQPWSWASPCFSPGSRSSE